MNLNNLVEKRKQKNKEIRVLVDNAKKLCCDFFQDQYTYCDNEAIDELGLERELIDQLVEDYVIQIIKSLDLFREHIDTLHQKKKEGSILDYTPLRELAHKNLGVARNLRIKDSEDILTRLMKQENIEDFHHYVNLLEACVIKLKPFVANSSLELIQIKKKL